VPADALQHRVVVSAPGHTSASRLVRFDGLQQLEFQLTPEPAPTNPAGERTAQDDDSRAARDEDEKKPSRRGARVHAASPPPGPAAPAPQTVPGEAPARAGGACDPPYYFKDGVKTYRDECL
jgi:hypothetical protein